MVGLALGTKPSLKQQFNPRTAIDDRLPEIWLTIVARVADVRRGATNGQRVFV
jgi:hypothetical protein